MEQQIKKQWLVSLICFHSVEYIVPIICKALDAYCRGWFNAITFSPNYLRTVLLIWPLTHLVIFSLAYYYVYKMENKYALKVITILTFLFSYLGLHRLYNSGGYDWGGDYYIEYMISTALTTYASIFYFVSSYRFYSFIDKPEKILKIIGCCFVASVILSFSDRWSLDLIAWSTIGLFLLPIT